MSIAGFNQIPSDELKIKKPTYISPTREQLITKYKLDTKEGDAELSILTADFKLSAPSIFGLVPGESNTQKYINLALFLKYIEANQNLFLVSSNSNKKIPKLIFDINENNYCLTFPSQISSDPRICYVYNSDDLMYKITKNSEIDKRFKNTSNPTVGKVMYVFINIEYLSVILCELTNETGEIILESFLKRVLDDINQCLGGVNQLTFKVFDNIVKIIEEAPLKYGSLKEKQNYAKFNAYGIRPNEGSFISNVDFNVTVTNDMATTIAVGAQANGNQPGINSTAFSKFNSGLIDRINPYKLTDTDSNIESLKNLEDEINYKKLIEKFRKEVENIYINNTILNDENVATLKPLNIDFSKKYIGKITNEKKIPAPFFLPFDLNLTMLGLSGMKIFEKFSLTNNSEKILPSYYRDNNGKSLIDFVIFDMKHSIKNNKWETTIKGKSIPSENEGNIDINSKIDSKKDNYLINPYSSQQPSPISELIPSYFRGPNANNLRNILPSLDIKEKPKQLDENGDITPQLVEAAQQVFTELRKEFPSQPPLLSIIFTITAGNDQYHKNRNSQHRLGKAIDFTVSGLPSSKSQLTPDNIKILDRIVKVLDSLKQKKIIRFYQDEYRNPSGASTGGHIHWDIN
jgi:hypothetical protein